MAIQFRLAPASPPAHLSAGSLFAPRPARTSAPPRGRSQRAEGDQLSADAQRAVAAPSAPAAVVLLRRGLAALVRVVGVMFSVPAVDGLAALEAHREAREEVLRTLHLRTVAR